MRHRTAFVMIGILCIAIVTAVWLIDRVQTPQFAAQSNVNAAVTTPTPARYELLANEKYATSLTKQQVTAMLGPPSWQGHNSAKQDRATWESTFGPPPFHDRRFRFEAAFTNDGFVMYSSALATDSEGAWHQLQVDPQGRVTHENLTSRGF